MKDGAKTAATQQSSAIQPVSYSIGMIATPKAGGGTPEYAVPARNVARYVDSSTYIKPLNM